MQVKIEYDKKQVLQALRYHFITRREIKILIILVNVYAITSAIFFFMHKTSALNFLIGSLLWFGLMASFWRILPASIYKREKTFSDTFILHLTEYAIRLENAQGAVSWPWSKFSSVIESPYFFHLYFDTRTFFLIPKDGFQSTEEQIEARRIMKEKINKT